MNEPTLRQAFQAQAARNRPAIRDACPSAEALQQLASSTNVGENPAQVAQLEHVLTCAACRPEFELLRAAHSAVQEEEAGSTAKSHPLFTMRRVALAATVLIAAGLAGEYWNQANETVVRDGAPDASDIALVSPLNRSNGPAVPGPFVWRTVAGAAAYQVEVLDTTGMVLAQSTTADTVLRLSAADSIRVFSQPVFDWIVSARRSDGNERRSPLVRVRVAPIGKR